MIRDFSSSVTRMAEFHTSRNPGTVIEQIRLMGTGINLIGFTEILGKELGLEVVTIKELNGVKIAKKNLHGLNYELLADYLPLLGALTQSLNLKAGEQKKGTDWHRIAYLLIAVALLANAAMAGFFIWQYFAMKGVKANLETQIAAEEPAEAVYNAYNNAQSDYAQIKEYYDSTKNSNEMLYTMILDLEEVMPESVGITNLTAENGAVDITGVAGGKSALSKFVIELKKLSYVSNVRVENVADTYDEFGNSTSAFNLNLQLNFPEENSEEVTEEENAEQSTGEDSES